MTLRRDCAAFRTRLENVLVGRPMPAELTALAWHEHLSSCNPCRELLEREEALEALLSSLPDPRLAPELKLRVIRRLQHARADGLDTLLEMDAGARAPSGLAQRVLASVRADQALDGLLDRSVVEIPSGLAQRVLAELEAERFPLEHVGQPWTLLRRRGLLATAAAVGFVSLSWWTLRESRTAPESGSMAPIAEFNDLGEAELIAFLERDPEAFEMLRNPLVWSSDDEPELALGATLAMVDETVIEFESP